MLLFVVITFRSTWNGCETQTVLYNDEPINLTCTGEKRFDTDRNQPRRQPSSSSSSFTGSDPPAPRRIYMALSNCRSAVGLMMHYRLEVFGNVDSLMCSGALTYNRLQAVHTLLLLMTADWFGGRVLFALLPAVGVNILHAAQLR